MIFVLPSRYEPFGIVLLEAGSFGVPVIASRVGGIGEIISHNSTGRLCESEDVGSLADVIRNA
jgi:glycosyltransferase involved in cell wall biosynthesis